MCLSPCIYARNTFSHCSIQHIFTFTRTLIRSLLLLLSCQTELETLRNSAELNKNAQDTAVESNLKLEILTKEHHTMSNQLTASELARHETIEKVFYVSKAYSSAGHFNKLSPNVLIVYAFYFFFCFLFSYYPHNSYLFMSFSFHRKWKSFW